MIVVITIMDTTTTMIIANVGTIIPMIAVMTTAMKQPAVGTIIAMMTMLILMHMTTDIRMITMTTKAMLTASWKRAEPWGASLPF
jgi:hypothetical protein